VTGHMTGCVLVNLCKALHVDHYIYCTVSYYTIKMLFRVP